MGLRRAGSSPARHVARGPRDDRVHAQGRAGLTASPPLPLEEPLERAFAHIAALAPAAVLAAFARYGKPLAVAMPALAADDRVVTLEPPGDARVRLLQVVGWGSVIADDYFVLERSADAPQAVSAPFFAAAIAALARAAGLGDG